LTWYKTTAHDSTITVVYPAGPDQPPHAIYTIQLPSLPSISLLFISETSIIAAGHDCRPVLFSGDSESGWSEIKSLDDPENRVEATSENKSGSSSVGRLNKSEAFNMFRAADSRGVGGKSAATSSALAGTRQTANGTELLTIHQNTITSVRAYEGGLGGSDVTKISTTGVDGRLVIWNTADVEGVTKGVGRLGL
jgi:actin related protein 2/3 complex subunit 1A/1B